MSRLKENKPFHQMDDKERLNEAIQFGGVLIEKHVDEGEYHPDQMNAMSWLIERVEESEKNNRYKQALENARISLLKASVAYTNNCDFQVNYRIQEAMVNIDEALKEGESE